MPAATAASASARAGVSADGDRAGRCPRPRRRARIRRAARPRERRARASRRARPPRGRRSFRRDDVERALQRRRARVVGVVDQRDAAASRCTAPRRSARRSAAARAAIVSSGMSNSRATAVAASTLARLPRPRSGVSMRAFAVRASSRVRACRRCRDLRRRRAHRAPSIAECHDPAGEPLARAITRGSSALQTSSVVRLGAFQDLGLGIRDGVERTRRSRDARRRRSSRRGRPARQSPPAC